MGAVVAFLAGTVVAFLAGGSLGRRGSANLALGGKRMRYEREGGRRREERRNIPTCGTNWRFLTKY